MAVLVVSETANRWHSNMMSNFVYVTSLGFIIENVWLLLMYMLGSGIKENGI